MQVLNQKIVTCFLKLTCSPNHSAGGDTERRIINDETHHDLAQWTESRTAIYHNPNLQQAKVYTNFQSRMLCDGYYVLCVVRKNCWRQRTSPDVFLWSFSHNFWVKTIWLLLDGIPIVEIQFWCPSQVISGSFIQWGQVGIWMTPYSMIAFLYYCSMSHFAIMSQCIC